MVRKVEDVANKMGITVAGTVPEYSAGAFGVAKLAKTLRDRLEPGRGKRPGRPSVAHWSKCSKIPLAAETEDRLEALARLLSDEHRKGQPDAGGGADPRGGDGELLSARREAASPVVGRRR